MADQLIVNVFEKVDFPEFGITGMSAKMDTGAFTGALHSTKIYVDKSDTEPVLHFSPFDHPEVNITTTNFRRARLKSSNGQTEQRYIIKTTIALDGKPYSIHLSLADRSSMKIPVLIGRRFMRRHGLMVDVTIKKRKG